MPPSLPPGVLAKLRKQFPNDDLFDAAQAAAVEALATIPQDVRSVEAWVFKCSRNAVNSLLARREVERGIFVPQAPCLDGEESSTPETALLAEEQSQLLQAGMKALPADLAEVIRLKFWEGQTDAQIATSLGIQERQVRRLLQRALGLLRDSLS